MNFELLPMVYQNSWGLSSTPPSHMSTLPLKSAQSCLESMIPATLSFKLPRIQKWGVHESREQRSESRGKEGKHSNWHFMVARRLRVHPLLYTLFTQSFLFHSCFCFLLSVSQVLSFAIGLPFTDTSAEVSFLSARSGTSLTDFLTSKIHSNLFHRCLLSYYVWPYELIHF